MQSNYEPACVIADRLQGTTERREYRAGSALHVLEEVFQGLHEIICYFDQPFGTTKPAALLALADSNQLHKRLLVFGDNYFCPFCR